MSGPCAAREAPDGRAGRELAGGLVDGVDADFVGAEVRREDEGACGVEGDLVGVCDCLLRVGGGLGELVGDVLVGCAVGGEGELVG